MYIVAFCSDFNYLSSSSSYYYFKQISEKNYKLGFFLLFQKEF